MCFFFKTYSIRDRRGDVPRLAKIRPIREPPIITTTAATPQDSPNTTLESGSTFRNWGQPDSDSTEVFINFFINDMYLGNKSLTFEWLFEFT